NDGHDVVPRLERPKPRRAARGLPPRIAHKALPLRAPAGACDGAGINVAMALSRFAKVGSSNCNIVRFDKRKSIDSRLNAAILELASSESSRFKTSGVSLRGSFNVTPLSSLTDQKRSAISSIRRMRALMGSRY